MKFFGKKPDPMRAPIPSSPNTYQTAPKGSNRNEGGTRRAVRDPKHVPTRQPQRGS